jgi:hypothetical protein
LQEVVAYLQAPERFARVGARFLGTSIAVRAVELVDL